MAGFIDIAAMQSDPEFQALPAEQQQSWIKKAAQQNAAFLPPATYGEAAKRAGRNVLMSLPEGALGAANLAYQLWREPRRTATEAVKATPEFLLSTLPMQRTVRKKLKGEPVTGPEVAQEALENVGSLAAGKLGGALLKRIPRGTILGIPGAGAEAHAVTIPKAEALPDTYRPTATAVRAADAAFEAATGQTMRWHMGEFQNAIEDLLKEQRQLSNPDTGFIDELQNYLRTASEGWTPAQLRAESRDLGAKVGGLKAERGRAPEQTTKGRINTREGQYRRLLSALYADADAAQPAVAGTFAFTPESPSGPHPPIGTAAGPAAGDIPMEQVGGAGAGPRSDRLIEIGKLWKQSRALHRRDLAANSLARMIDDSISAVGQEGMENINLRPVIKKIRRAQRKQEYDAQSRLFVNSFEKGEVDDIVKTLRTLQRDLRPIPAGRGVAQGSSQRWLHGAIGEVATEMLGGPRFLGAALGMVGGDALSQLMMTRGGRALVRTALKIDPHVGPVFQNMVAAYLRGEMQPQAVPLPGPVQAAPSPQPTPSPTPQVNRTASPVDELLYAIIKGGLAPGTGATP